MTHLATSTSTVRCGAKMRGSWKDEGWDLGDVTTDPMKVTCPKCKGKK